MVDIGATGPGAERISAMACTAIAARLARFPGLTVVGPPAAAGAGAVSRPAGAGLLLEIAVTADG